MASPRDRSRLGASTPVSSLVATVIGPPRTDPSRGPWAMSPVHQRFLNGKIIQFQESYTETPSILANSCLAPILVFYLGHDTWMAKFGSKD
jgi:hypothetical protein